MTAQGLTRSGSAIGRVRPLTEDDIPGVAGLHERIFGDGVGRPARKVAPYLTEMFCRNPWRDDELPSLVYEEADGRIIGCLGVMPRPMSLGGRPIRAAITHTFMVEADRRASLAAIRLVQAFLAGSQDLSLAEGNDTSRRIWEAFGGATSLLYSLRWTRPLRPARYILTVLRRRGWSSRWDSMLRPLVSVTDAVATRSAFRPPAPRLTGGELTAEILLEGLERLSGDRALRPEYDARALRWLLELLARKTAHGAFRTVVVRDGRGEAAGWYLYYLNPGGPSEVVQIAARSDSMGEVLEHLFHDAWRHGAVAVSGPLDPTALRAAPDRYCLFHHDGGAWMLIHSRHPEVLEAIHRGDAFLSRLEGEWWIGI
ncbi:MAG: GNAT family N-acetyltransferase [Candidatus Rokubacteria bacterium]|nr:GNAT family N-acetyltransferase [Candidatus Rokubacteria bacterium]